MSKKLTIKQEAFVLAYIETGNASEAYRQAYPRSVKWKPESVNRKAFEMLGNVKIMSRVEALQAEHAERHNVTTDSLTKQAEKIYTGAMDAQQYSAAKGALDLMAKLHGKLTDQHNMKVTTVADVETMSDAELITILRSAGVDPEMIKP